MEAAQACVLVQGGARRSPTTDAARNLTRASTANHASRTILAFQTRRLVTVQSTPKSVARFIECKTKIRARGGEQDRREQRPSYDVLDQARKQKRNHRQHDGSDRPLNEHLAHEFHPRHLSILCPQWTPT